MVPGKKQTPHIDAFNFVPGRVIAGQYEIITRLGAGWEGEVYLVRERTTGIEKTAKFFFPQRNQKEKASRFYARKLHKLRQCSIVIQYYAQNTVICRGAPVIFLVSEFVEGELLSLFLQSCRGKRLPPFQAVHLLHAMASGIECIHQLGEYHGDLHTENIIVSRYGLNFELKLLDLFLRGAPTKKQIHEDVIDMVRIFYDAVGGQKHYAKQPREVKEICCGLKRCLILKKFRSAGQLRAYLESMSWSSR